MSKDPFLSAAEASALLGVRPASLYAYVSRSRLRALPHPHDMRARLYRRDEIEALALRKKQQARPGEAAAHALDWGLPVLASTVSSIANGRLFYRGRDAADLAEKASIEDVAALLWGTETVAFTGGSRRETPRDGTAIDRAIAALAADLPDALPGEQGARRMMRACRTVRRIAAASSVGWLAEGPLHIALAAAWQSAGAADAIRRALVLLADHELNASTFAVRVAASTATPLTHAVIAGLATLAGPRHGGATQRVAAFLDEARHFDDPERAVSARLARGEDLPGFGHRLYPNGDPRAAALLPVIGIDSAAERLIQAAEAATGLRPTVDVALVMLERRFRLPREAALALFAIGRSVGWIAHAMEQAQSGQLIRPRAQLSG